MRAAVERHLTPALIVRDEEPWIGAKPQTFANADLDRYFGSPANQAFSAAILKAAMSLGEGRRSWSGRSW